MTQRRPLTAVIGAGISGLTAGKALGDRGIPYVCFESSDRIGGNWAFGNPNGHSSAYRSLHIDTSKNRLSFRDYSMPADYPDFPHHTDIFRYLEGYAAAFDLKRNIKFGKGIEHAGRLPGGGWELRTQDQKLHRFDALVVANGHHWDPRFPNFPGTFSGESIHSHHYIDPTEPLDLQDKRILVVGMGNSAADIASELSQRSHRNSVTLSTRSGGWVIPKYIFGSPSDKVGRTIPWLPIGLQRLVVRQVPLLVSGRPEKFGLPRPEHKFLDSHPTMSSELLLRLGSGDMRAKPNIETLDGSRVHFVDGTEDEFDVIIYATGYNISFPFFDPDFISAPENHLKLFKRMWKPGIDDLVFIGFAQAVPTLFPFVEFQSRVCAEYLDGAYRTPSEEEMHRIIAADDHKYLKRMSKSARHTQQLDYFVYEYQMKRQELPKGRRRAKRLGPAAVAGRASENVPA